MRNTWYVAAWSDEVSESDQLHRRLLGRADRGSVTA
jgi:hypothetical protein